MVTSHDNVPKVQGIGKHSVGRPQKLHP